VTPAFTRRARELLGDRGHRGEAAGGPPAGGHPGAGPKNTSSASRLWLARRMTGMLVGALPGRHIRVVADSACAAGS
jgi:hypothetical protein